MLKFYTFILVTFFTTQVFSQKTLEKEISALQIDTIVIDGDGIFKITITTTSTTSIKLKASIDGETFENLIVTEKLEMGSITFGLDYAPFFKPENDKLAAHKVMAVEVFLEIPKNKIVNVTSNLASFIGNGTFKNLNVALDKGDCIATNFIGNGMFQTLEGSIIIEAFPQVSGTAISHNGLVLNELNKHQIFNISAESKHGNIRLTQTEY